MKDYRAGIDIGSTTVKLVVLGDKDEILFGEYRRHKGHTQATLAAITLAEATARAVERIPDAHCNGDMHAALDYAEGVERKIRDFLQTQGVKAVVK